VERLHAKCFFASVGTHLFLLVLLLIGSAFFFHKPAKEISQEPYRQMEMIPGPRAEEALSAANPAVGVPRPSQPATRQIPTPLTTTARAPASSLPHGRDAGKKPQTRKAPEDIRNWLEPTQRTPPRGKGVLNESHAEPPSDGQQSTDATSRQIAGILGGVARKLQDRLNEGTKVNVSAMAGQAYASYGVLVKEAYDRAWSLPGEVTAADATTKVAVVIARSGKVLNAEILTGSDNPMLDESVRGALKKVTFVAPFPAESQDQEKKFIIHFNLATKQFTAW